jgi:hypothetical protein
MKLTDFKKENSSPSGAIRSFSRGRVLNAPSIIPTKPSRIDRIVGRDIMSKLSSSSPSMGSPKALYPICEVVRGFRRKVLMLLNEMMCVMIDAGTINGLDMFEQLRRLFAISPSAR